MTQKRFDNHYNYFYHDHNGQRRNYGIYAPGLDRFIHISNKDIWISFETANLISSKIATILYVMPPGCNHIDNKNCINFGLFDKTSQKVWTSNILVGRQNPMIKMLYPEDKIVDVGIHSDFKDNQEILNKLSSYTEYVYEQSMAIKLSDAFYNSFNNKDFINNYLDLETQDMVSLKKDWTGSNILQRIKNVLYLSDNQEEADKKIIDIWKSYSTDIGFMLEGYYKILDKPVPAELINYAGMKSYKNTSAWVF